MGYIQPMYLTQTNINELRERVEQGGGFQVALAPMQPATFAEVKQASDKLYRALIEAGLTVLVDDRGQKPKNMFAVIEFLKIRHRVVISGRSLSAGVVEYKDLQTDHFEKVPLDEIAAFLVDLTNEQG